MPRGVILPAFASGVLDAASWWIAGALDEARAVGNRGRFDGPHIVIDVYLPTPRIGAARRLTAADPAGYCPLPEGEAALAIAGPIGSRKNGPPWRYRLAIARRADLLDGDGRPVRARAVFDVEAGRTLVFSPPPRTLSEREVKRLVAGFACLLAVSWALASAADWMDRSAEATRAEARSLASEAPERVASVRLAALLDVLQETGRAAPISSISTGPDGARMVILTSEIRAAATRDDIEIRPLAGGQETELLSLWSQGGER